MWMAGFFPAVAFLSMAGQRSRTGAASTADKCPCTGTQTGCATDRGTAAGPKQSTCHRPGARGAATTGKAEDNGHHGYDAKCL